MFVDFNMKKNQYLLYSYSQLIETRYSFLFSKLSKVYIYKLFQKWELSIWSYFKCLLWVHCWSDIFYCLIDACLTVVFCQCNFFQFYWLTQELWNMILTLLILYHSKCVFISWNAYVILKQLVLRKRDPIIDS